MLKIEKDSDGSVIRLRLTGRIQSHHIASVQSAMSDCCERKILALSEVTLVDLEVVRFLISCEDEGIGIGSMPSLCARVDSSRTCGGRVAERYSRAKHRACGPSLVGGIIRHGRKRCVEGLPASLDAPYEYE
jgi:hypothetical protein